MGWIEVVYDERRWSLLKRKRAIAKELMKALSSCGYSNAVIHGSVARGDVDEDSDVDVALLNPAPVGMVELCLERAGFKVFQEVIVQPTPVHTPKVYLYLDPDEEKVVSIPLVELDPIEKDFYRFSGCLTLSQLLNDVRVPGVDKRLMLIVPTLRGHVEAPVVGNEGFVARFLGVSIQVVLDRVKALTRRVEEGHTGLFVEAEVPPGKSVEEVVKDLCRENRLFRQRVHHFGLC